MTSLDPRPTPVGSLFVFLELLAIVAVPILGYVGVRTLLDSRAGQFLSEPGPDDPGFRALVDPSPVVAVVETTDGKVTGMVIIARSGADAVGGNVLVVPSELVVEGLTLGERSPEAAVEALGAVLRLHLPAEIVLGESDWSSVIGTDTYEIDNPDPLAASDGVAQFAVGPVELDAEELVRYLAADRRMGPDGPVPDDPRSRLHRRGLAWSALLEDPPSGVGALNEWLRAVGSGSHRVELLPVEGSPLVLADTAEDLLVELVPFVAGSAVGDRLRLRVLGDPSEVDVYEAAAMIARTGVEVVELGNVSEDGGAASTGDRPVLIVPQGLDDERVGELARRIGAASMISDEFVDEAEYIITLILGGPIEGL